MWIDSFADKRDPLASEWALAWFALDNMMHRACHAGASAIQLRRSHKTSPEIESAIVSIVDPILASHAKWRQRRVVVDAYEDEQHKRKNASFVPHFPRGSMVSPIRPTSQPPSPIIQAPGIRFLDHEPVHLTNHFFANLLNHHRSISLCLSLILHPQAGTPDIRSFNCAVDLCRTHAGFGDDRYLLTTGKLWGLHLAGLTFGGPDIHPVLIKGDLANNRESRSGLLKGWMRLGSVIVLHLLLLSF
jgi:hypothetical protein